MSTLRKSPEIYSTGLPPSGSFLKTTSEVSDGESLCGLLVQDLPIEPRGKETLICFQSSLHLQSRSPALKQVQCWLCSTPEGCLLFTDMANWSLIIPSVTVCSQWSGSEPQAYSELGFLNLECSARIYRKLTATVVPVDRKLTSVKVSFGVTTVLTRPPCKEGTILLPIMSLLTFLTALTTGGALCEGRRSRKRFNLEW